jgi:hypothetical protein
MQSEKEASEPADASKTELRQTWEKAAPGWAKWEHTFSAGLSAATEALIDMAGIRPLVIVSAMKGLFAGVAKTRAANLAGRGSH